MVTVPDCFFVESIVDGSELRSANLLELGYRWVNSPASVPASLVRKNRTDRSMQFQYMDEFFVSSLGVFQNEDMCILIHVWMEAIELGRSQPHISASKGKKQKQLRREKNRRWKEVTATVEEGR